MNYAVVDLVWAESHGIKVLPEWRKSTDGKKVLMHEERLIPFEDEEFPRYSFADPEFKELLESPEWKYPDGEAPVVNSDLSRILAIDELTSDIESTIQTMSFTNKEKLQVKKHYPEWKVGIDVKKGYCYQNDDKLFECDMDHKTQADWESGASGAYSLWHEVTDDESGQGTKENPIPYNTDHNPLFQGMILSNGKYYTQDNVVYLCTRDTGIAVYSDLKDLVGLYVEVSE